MGNLSPEEMQLLKKLLEKGGLEGGPQKKKKNRKSKKYSGGLSVENDNADPAPPPTPVQTQGGKGTPGKMIPINQRKHTNKFDELGMDNLVKNKKISDEDKQNLSGMAPSPRKQELKIDIRCDRCNGSFKVSPAKTFTGEDDRNPNKLVRKYICDRCVNAK